MVTAKSVLSVSDVQQHVQRFLGSAVDIFRLSCCCSEMLAASDDRALGWRALCVRDFSGFITSEPVVHAAPGADGAPGSWRSMFHSLSDLRRVRWRNDESGAGASAQLTSDRNTYSLTRDGALMLRSGGKYFFNVSVLQTDSLRLEEIAADPPEPPPPPPPPPTTTTTTTATAEEDEECEGASSQGQSEQQQGELEEVWNACTICGEAGAARAEAKGEGPNDEKGGDDKDQQEQPPSEEAEEEEEKEEEDEIVISPEAVGLTQGSMF